MSTAPEATNPKPSPAALAVIVLGRDDAGKAHAAWFDQSEAALAEKAADFMNMRVLRVRTDEHRALGGPTAAWARVRQRASLRAVCESVAVHGASSRRPGRSGREQRQAGR